MYLGLLKRMLFETDKRLLWKLAWNMGFKGLLSVQKHKKTFASRKILSSVLIHLDHQQLQFTMSGVLGRCGAQAAQD